MLTAEQLSAAVRCTLTVAAQWLQPIVASMERFDINTPSRQAAFLAQIGHESSHLHYTRELWNPAQCPWQAHYEGRLDLGNTEPGDGSRFRGRGLIQITGRANYRDCGHDLGVDLVAHPESLEEPDLAALSAGWFWHVHGCNELADAENFRAITRVINGGYNGLYDRLALWDAAKAAIV